MQVRKEHLQVNQNINYKHNNFKLHHVYIYIAFNNNNQHVDSRTVQAVQVRYMAIRNSPISLSFGFALVAALVAAVVLCNTKYQSVIIYF